MKKIMSIALYLGELSVLTIILTVVQPKNAEVDGVFRLAAVVVIVLAAGIIALGSAIEGRKVK